MIEPCINCVQRRQRNTNIFDGCFRTSGCTIDNKCCECHNAGCLCLGGVPAAEETPPSQPLRKLPRTTDSLKQCRGTYDSSENTSIESSTSATSRADSPSHDPASNPSGDSSYHPSHDSSYSSSGVDSSMVSSRNYLTSPIMNSLQSSSRECSSIDHDGLRNKILLDNLSALTIVSSKSHQNFCGDSRDDCIANNDTSFNSPLSPESVHYFSCRSTSSMLVDQDGQESSCSDESPKSSVTIVQQPLQTHETRSKLALSHQFPTKGGRLPFPDPYMWRDVGISCRKPTGKGPKLREDVFMSGALDPNGSDPAVGETGPGDSKLQNRALAIRAIATANISNEQQKPEQKKERPCDSLLRAESREELQRKKRSLCPSPTTLASNPSGKRPRVEVVIPLRKRDSSQAKKSTNNTEPPESQALGSKKQGKKKRKNRKKHSQHPQVNDIEDRGMFSIPPLLDSSLPKPRP